MTTAAHGSPRPKRVYAMHSIAAPETLPGISGDSPDQTKPGSRNRLPIFLGATTGVTVLALATVLIVNGAKAPKQAQQVVEGNGPNGVVVVVPSERDSGEEPTAQPSASASSANTGGGTGGDGSGDLCRRETPAVREGVAKVLGISVTGVVCHVWSGDNKHVYWTHPGNSAVSLDMVVVPPLAGGAAGADPKYWKRIDGGVGGSDALCNGDRGAVAVFGDSEMLRVQVRDENNNGPKGGCSPELVAFAGAAVQAGMV